MQLNKTKLIEALKKRRAEVVKRAENRQKAYEKAVAAYQTKVVERLTDILTAAKAAKDLKETDRIVRKLQNFYVEYPGKPPKPSVTAIDKALIELDLLDDSTMTVESNKDYLAVLSGNGDYEPDPDDYAEETDEEEY